MTSAKAVLLDISGVLYEGDTAIVGADAALALLAAAGLPYRLITNTTRRPKDALLDRLRRFGFSVRPGEVFTATEALIQHLRLTVTTPFLLVHRDLEPVFADLIGGPPAAVVVADAGDGFTYARMNAAFRLLMAGAPLLAVATNRYFRDSDGLALDAGPFVAALEYAAGVKAEVFGKPSPRFFHSVLADLGTSPTDTVMIGDDVEADVNGAINCGLRGILVRTGKFRPADEQRVAAGGTIADDVLAAVRSVTGRGPDAVVGR